MSEPSRSKQRATTSSTASAKPVEHAATDSISDRSALDRLRHWITSEASPYMVSMLVHTAIFLVMALTLGVHAVVTAYDTPVTLSGGIEVEVDSDEPEIVITPPQVPEAPIATPHEDPMDEGESKLAQGEPNIPTAMENEPEGNPMGGIGKLDGEPPGTVVTGPRFNGVGRGPRLKGDGGAIGNPSGKLGSGDRPFEKRGHLTQGDGGTERTQGAVTLALDWLSRHQSRDGSWSIDNFHKNCQYGKCSGPGSSKSDAGATALGLLPFLGAGHTHHKAGKHQRAVKAGIDWLVTHQKPDGDLSAGSSHVMYSHGLAAIALCEAYGMSGDSRVGHAAQAAIKFIEAAQNKQDGGWRYRPGDAGDTSVVGWQLMALKSGQMAKLQVNQAALDGVTKWLGSVGKGDYSGIFRYQPEREGSLPSMTAVGILCKEYLGAGRGDPSLQEGIEYLMKNLPDAKSSRNVYYWYYATQSLHHMMGPNWDTWNRKMRKILVDTQVRGKGCEVGSWDPQAPSPDQWGGAGGRLMCTSLSCLTLEVYYRHLPLYDLHGEGAVPSKKK